MGTVKSLIDGFVNAGDGVPVLLSPGDVFEDSHPLVQSRPELFEAVPDPTPKRPILSRKPKDGDG